MHQYTNSHCGAKGIMVQKPGNSKKSSSKSKRSQMIRLVPVNKLLKKIDGDRPPRSLGEAYHQALDLERKNQITKRYEMTVQVSQISDCALEEDIEEVDAMELHPRDNTKRVFQK